MSDVELDCGLDARRHALVAKPSWNGIDYVEVADDQRSLLVYFFAPPPQGLGLRNFRIEGGRRIAGIAVTGVTPVPGDEERGADSLRVALDRYGDFSTYTLRLVDAGKDTPPAGIDPRYASVAFSFKIDCPNDLDCAAVAPCIIAPAVSLDIDYLAKDYESFRQLLLDRLATTSPTWRERHVPDLGITAGRIARLYRRPAQRVPGCRSRPRRISTRHARASRCAGMRAWSTTACTKAAMRAPG